MEISTGLAPGSFFSERINLDMVFLMILGSVAKALWAMSNTVAVAP